MGKPTPFVDRRCGADVGFGLADLSHADRIGHRAFLSIMPPAGCRGQAKLKIVAEPEGTGAEKKRCMI
jgi:hypothetical protein